MTRSIRLAAATHPNQTNESYTYDDVGNRIASHQGSSYSYQAFNRLVTANSNTYGYDTNGSMISKSDATGNWSYAWDYENRLKQGSLSGGITANYNYDALGRRVQRSSTTSGTTRFVHDGLDVIRDLDGSGAAVADYLNGPKIDDKLRQTVSGVASYFLTDHLSTTRSLTDSSGSMTATMSYDSFGNVSAGSAPTRYAYTGREVDSELGLMYYRARWYDMRQGRFVSEDPLGLAGGLNLFTYVENNPLRFSDPNGLCPQSPSKQKCKQDKTGADRDDIEELLRRAGLRDSISKIKSADPKNPEGIIFEINNRESFVNTLNADTRFRHNTPFGSEHTGQVGGNIRNTRDYRSFTTTDGLGPDSTGNRRSLQIDVGPAGLIEGKPLAALGYADLDCDNPAQDMISGLKHGVPIVFRRLGGFFRR